MQDEPDDAPPTILGPDGKPARSAAVFNTRCPQCGADADQRRPSCGFGAPHDICGRCAFEWIEE